MNSKGQVWEPILKIALVIIVLFISTFLIFRQTGIAQDSLNACEERGGACMSVCSDATAGPGAYIEHAGTGACEENEVCCKGPLITQRQQQGNRLPPGSREIVVTVSGKTSEYTSGDTINMVTGKQYGFNVSVHQNHDGLPCRAYVKDANQDSVITMDVGQGNQNLPKITYDFGCSSSGVNLGGVYSNFMLSERHLFQDLEMDIIVYKQGASQGDGMDSWEASAKLNINLEKPVEILGIGSAWTNNEEIALRCREIECRSAKVWLVYGTYSTMLGACTGTAPANVQEKIFRSSGEADFELGVNNMTGVGQSLVPGAHTGRVCAHITQNLQVSPIKVMSDPILKLDVIPPTLQFDPANLVATCNDGLGSQCKGYWYDVKAQLTGQQIRGVDEQTAINLIQSALTGDVSCEVLGHRDYRFIAHDDDINAAVIDTGNALVGKVCIYAEDNAGNLQQAVSAEAFYDQDEVKEKLASSFLDFIQNTFFG